MKCLILSGGHGTRLRPLTLSVPKALVEFCNSPIIEYQISAAKKAGVDHIILAFSESQPELVKRIEELKLKYDIRMDYSIESSPLGTAGCIRLAKDLLCEENDESNEFFVLNTDVICKYPLNELLKSHKQKNATITILVTKVDNPSSFGVVLHDTDYRITGFIEKPSEFVSDLINAGVYILNKSVIDSIPLENTSIERQIFPKFVSLGNVYCHPLTGYWSDIGTPSEYLRGQYLHLTSDLNDDCRYFKRSMDGFDDMNGCNRILRLYNDSILIYYTNDNNDISNVNEDLYTNIFNGVNFKGVCLIHKTAKIGNGSIIGPNVVISENVVIGNYSRITRSSIMKNAKIDHGSYIHRSIIGWKSHIGSWVGLHEHNEHYTHCSI